LYWMRNSATGILYRLGRMEYMHKPFHGQLLTFRHRRSGEVLADWLWTGLLPWLPLSGLLVWLAVASVFATVLGATPSRRGAAAPPRSPG